MKIKINEKEYFKLKEEFDNLIQEIITHALKNKYFDWRRKKIKKKIRKPVNDKNYEWIKPNWNKSRCAFPKCEIEKELVEWNFEKDKPVIKKLCAYHNSKVRDGLITKFDEGFNWNYAQWHDGKAALPIKLVPATPLFIEFIKTTGNDSGNRKKIRCEDCGEELFAMKRDRFDKWGYGYHVKPFKRTSFFVDERVCCYRCAKLRGWGERVGSC